MWENWTWVHSLCVYIEKHRKHTSIFISKTYQDTTIIPHYFTNKAVRTPNINLLNLAFASPQISWSKTRKIFHRANLSKSQTWAAKPTTAQSHKTTQEKPHWEIQTKIVKI